MSNSRQSSFPFFQDAIRVQAQLMAEEEGVQNLSRKFSVDPQLTNFDILRNLIGRAFDLKSDFAISYRAFDDYGSETFLPMVSDWDLSAAFLSASDPDLQLMVEPKDIPLDLENGCSYEDEPWEFIRSTEIQTGSSSAINKHIQNSQQEPKSPSKIIPQQLTNAYNAKINTAGIFNTMERWVQKAKTFVEDISVATRPPLSDIEFRNYLDPAGVLYRPRELRFACYHGGIEPSLRKVVWKHLLNVYPEKLTGNGRIEYIKKKSKEYCELRDIWKNAIQNGQTCEEISCVSNMVRKDVLRTDRHIKFFAGHDEHQNIASLYNILTTFALNHPSVSYCQGMSDIASPLLVIMGDEAQAYICLCSVMERLQPNFMPDGQAMSIKFAHLAEAVAYYDSYYWSYLKTIGADDLLFCYRWLLLELKREFAFEDALRMYEVLWASLPHKPQNVSLYEEKFTGASINVMPMQIPMLASSYSKVCAMRRSSTAANPNDIRKRRLSRKPKASPHLSLDENSLTSLSSSNNKSDNFNNTSHKKPFYSLDDTMEILSSSDIPSLLSTSPFEIISLNSTTISQLTNSNSNSNNVANNIKQGPNATKLVKNLREFWQIGKSPSKEEIEGEFGAGAENVNENETSNSESNSTEQNTTKLASENDNENEECNPNVNASNPTSSSSVSKSFSSINSINFKNLEITNNRKTPSPSENERDDVKQLNKNIILTSSSSNIKDNENDNDDKINKKVTDSNSSEYKDNSNNSSKNSKKDSAIAIEGDGEGDIRRLVSNSLQAHAHGDSFFDSENDSGQCSESLDENSLEEPEFQSASRKTFKLPPPETFGGGNPFLMFLCLTLLLTFRDHILRNQLDYNEIGLFYDKMIRKHNVIRVLSYARQMYSNYLKQNVPRV